MTPTPSMVVQDAWKHSLLAFAIATILSSKNTVRPLSPLLYNNRHVRADGTAIEQRPAACR